MSGKIQIHKMKKDHNIEAVRDELRERGCLFAQIDNWIALFKILKTTNKTISFLHRGLNTMHSHGTARISMMKEK